MRLKRTSAQVPNAAPELDGAGLNGAYDLQTVELIRTVMQPGDVGIDIGAHEGAILRHICAASPTATHHAFEPIPALAAGLRATFPGVVVHEVALSDSSGSVTFNHVVSNPGYSGLRERRYDRPDEDIDVIEVRTERLDEVLGDQIVPRFVKIDVEGAEGGVLRGGVQMLGRARPFVVFEHGLGAADFYGTTPSEIHDLLHGELDLTVTLIASWLSSVAPLSKDQFVDEFSSGRNYYFLAHAAGSRRA